MSSSLSWPGVVCGLEAEAVIARQFLSHVAVSAGRADRARIIARQLLEQGADGLVSFGIAGGLDRALKCGDLVIGQAVSANGQLIAADAHWVASLARQLPDAHCGTVLGCERIIFDPAGKADAYAQSGALAVDMESHAVAEVAAAYGRPFVVLRAIADTAEVRLPELVAHGLDDQGRPQILPILGRLLLAPWELPALISAGNTSAMAMRTLLCRSGAGLISLGRLGSMNLGHGLLDMT